MIGKTILHYKVIAKLGEGGMGVVYKAEDTKLDREVALKFLPANSIGTKEEKSRFQQEAKAAAKLSHANIAHVYEINEHEGETFIAMEYIDGETLSDRIEQGPLKLPEAIKIAIQCAEGLQAAHEKEITHRDIKSQNVMLTSKDVVKIMDFGLAKLSGRSMVTKEGSTLGTTTYMSPEQARGEKADQRSDIWSLGVVLFEMISGGHPFSGDYEQAVIYAILNEEAEPLTAVRTGVPMELERIVNKCLTKDLELRYQGVADLIADLKAVDPVRTKTSAVRPSAMSQAGGAAALSIDSGVHTETVGQGSAVQPAPKPSSTSFLPWIIAAVLGIGLVFSLILLLTRESEQPPQPLTASLLFDEGAGPVVDRHPALSPDATQLAYVTSDVYDGGRIWIRDLTDGTARALEDTEGATWPFWSPDGSMLGFFAGGQLQVLPVAGGSSIRLATAPLPAGGTWNEENIILYSPINGPLWQIPAAGGTPIQVTQPENDNEQHLRPSFLPGGQSFLFQTFGGEEGIYRGDLQTGRVEFIRKGNGPTYVALGHLVFHIGGSAFAQRFDPKEGVLSGQPVPLLSGLVTPYGLAAITVTPQMIAFVPGEQFRGFHQPVIVGRNGVVIDSLAHKEGGWVRKFSHDGKRVAIAGRRMWVHDLVRKVSEPVPTELNWPAIFAWSPGDSSIAYAPWGGQLRRVSVTGRAKEEVIFTPDTKRIASLEWSPDGQTILFVYPPDDSRRFWELWACDVAAGTANPVLKGSFNVYDARFAPNGQWFAYTSDEGRHPKDVFLRRFPDAGGTPRRVSTAGGAWPHWRKDGKELFYLNGEGHLVAVDLELDGDLFVSAEKIISPDPITTNPYNAVQSFDVSHDGQRYLRWGQAGESDASRLTILRDWIGMLEQL